ncbi:MAG: 4Fe-4S binding protein [Phycisphaeraceae bacterium]
MPSFRPRIKLLNALRKSPHRYTLIRAASQALSLAILLLVPLTGLAQVDAWRGRHWLLGNPASFKPALAGVIVAIAALYIITFLSNVVTGRLFCGWGCPVGQVSRFGDEIDLPGLKPRQRLIAKVNGALFSGAFVIAMMAWWVDLRVLILGDATAMAVAWSLRVGGAAGAYAHGRWWRWEFCKRVCPIGLYYSFVAPARYYGIHYRNEKETCLDCDACDHICPVDLKPRDLMAPASDRGGIAITDAPGHNHCLECGDCIKACEWMIEKRGHAPVPLKLGWFKGPQRDEPRDKAEAEQSLRPHDLIPPLATNENPTRDDEATAQRQAG